MDAQDLRRESRRLAKGITQGFLKDDEDEKEDIGQCYIRGPVFEGVAALADQPDPQAESKDKHERVLKLLMVHGVGTHFPGYSTRLAENLSRTLTLNVVDADIKQITLREPRLFPHARTAAPRGWGWSLPLMT